MTATAAADRTVQPRHVIQPIVSLSRGINVNQCQYDSTLSCMSHNLPRCHVVPMYDSYSSGSQEGGSAIATLFS